MAASKSKDNYYAIYKSSNRWKTNREAKLLRQLKLQPGNEKQITEALANLKYRRKTPQNRVWSHSMRRMAQLITEFGGKAHVNLFSTNPDLAKAAYLDTYGKHDNGTVPQGVVSFALGARLQGNR